MTTQLHKTLHEEMHFFGGKDVDLCMNCGTCTVICPLARDEGGTFPRRIIRLIQTGQKRLLVKSLDPWLCYYCGDCSENCPRQANPAETMMASRRYLTSQYDWTGLARLFYKSALMEILAIVLVGLFVTGLFVWFHGSMVLTLPVQLNTFAPVKWVELGDWIMAGTLSFFLLTNATRMVWNTLDGKQMFGISPLIYFKAVPVFFDHMFTQRRSRQCGSSRSRSFWLKHLLLVSGYLSMLVLVLILLRWFQTDRIYPIYNPQRLWGYYATLALLYPTGAFLISRWRRKEPIHFFSEASDWIFLVMLFLTALTGIMVSLARVNGFPMTTYVIYVIHLSIAVPMLVVEVPFSKWSHLLYRPLAMYLVSVKKAAAAVSLKTLPEAATA